MVNAFLVLCISTFFTASCFDTVLFSAYDNFVLQMRHEKTSIHFIHKNQSVFTIYD